jgi:hypothetical protein
MSQKRYKIFYYMNSLNISFKLPLDATKDTNLLTKIVQRFSDAGKLRFRDSAGAIGLEKYLLILTNIINHFTKITL